MVSTVSEQLHSALHLSKSSETKIILLFPVFQARDVYEEAIQTVMTVRDFGQVNVDLLEHSP